LDTYKRDFEVERHERKRITAERNALLEELNNVRQEMAEQKPVTPNFGEPVTR